LLVRVTSNSGVRLAESEWATIYSCARGADAVYGDNGIEGGWNAVNGGGDAEWGGRGCGVGFVAGDEIGGQIAAGR
jgi:hypothetical protein